MLPLLLVLAAQIEVFSDPGPTNITLATAVDTDDTAIVVSAGHGTLLPNPSAGDYFLITIRSASVLTTSEVLRCTARSTDTLTCARGLYGTAQTFSVGATIRHGANAQSMRATTGDVDKLIGIPYEARTCKGGARLLYAVPATGTAVLGVASNVVAIVGETSQVVSHPDTATFGAYATAVPHTLMTSLALANSGAGFFVQQNTAQGVSLQQGYLYEVTGALGAAVSTNNAGWGWWSELAADRLDNLDDSCALGHRGAVGATNFEIVCHTGSAAATVIELDGTCAGAPAGVTCLAALPFTTVNRVIRYTQFAPRALSDATDVTVPFIGFHVYDVTNGVTIAYGRLTTNISTRAANYITAMVTSSAASTAAVTLRLYSINGCRGWTP